MASPSKFLAGRSDLGNAKIAEKIQPEPPDVVTFSNDCCGYRASDRYRIDLGNGLRRRQGRDGKLSALRVGAARHAASGTEGSYGSALLRRFQAG